MPFSRENALAAAAATKLSPPLQRQLAGEVLNAVMVYERTLGRDPIRPADTRKYLGRIARAASKRPTQKNADTLGILIRNAPDEVVLSLGKIPGELDPVVDGWLADLGELESGGVFEEIRQFCSSALVDLPEDRGGPVGRDYAFLSLIQRLVWQFVAVTGLRPRHGYRDDLEEWPDPLSCLVFEVCKLLGSPIGDAKADDYLRQALTSWRAGAKAPPQS